MSDIVVHINDNLGLEFSKLFLEAYRAQTDPPQPEYAYRLESERAWIAKYPGYPEFIIYDMDLRDWNEDSHSWFPGLQESTASLRLRD